jgi:hypothetical protein
MTAGVAALPFADQAAIVGKVMSFEDFTEDNDPHGEHDFGAFDFKRERIFWKIGVMRESSPKSYAKPITAENQRLQLCGRKTLICRTAHGLSENAANVEFADKMVVGRICGLS